MWAATIILVSKMLGYTDSDDFFGISLFLLITPLLIYNVQYHFNQSIRYRVDKRETYKNIVEFEHYLRGYHPEMASCKSDEERRRFELEISD
jgi:hypothetical protein